MTAVPSALSPHYTCKLCRRTLTISGPPIIGENTAQKLGKVAQMMANHLGQEHQKEMVGIGIAGQQIVGWLITEQFQHNDEALSKASDDARLQFRRKTKRVQIPDSLIEHQAYEHLGALPTKDYNTVVGLLKGLRETIEENPPE